MRRFRTLAASALAGALTLAIVVPAAATGPAETTLRAFHNSPDTPRVAILVNGAASGIELSYPDITPYIKLPVGATVSVKVLEGRAAGAALDVTVPASSRPLTVAAIGSLAELLDGVAEPGDLRLQAYATRPGSVATGRSFASTTRAPTLPPSTSRPSCSGAGPRSSATSSSGESSSYLPLPQKNPFTGKLIKYNFRVKISGTSTVVTTVSTPLPNDAQTVWAIGFAGKLGAGTPDAFGLKITKDGRN